MKFFFFWPQTPRLQCIKEGWTETHFVLQVNINIILKCQYCWEKGGLWITDWKSFCRPANTIHISFITKIKLRLNVFGRTIFKGRGGQVKLTERKYQKRPKYVVFLVQTSQNVPSSKNCPTSNQERKHS